MPVQCCAFERLITDIFKDLTGRTAAHAGGQRDPVTRQQLFWPIELAVGGVSHSHPVAGFERLLTRSIGVVETEIVEQRLRCQAGLALVASGGHRRKFHLRFDTGVVMRLNAQSPVLRTHAAPRAVDPGPGCTADQVARENEAHRKAGWRRCCGACRCARSARCARASRTRACAPGTARARRRARAASAATLITAAFCGSEQR